MWKNLISYTFYLNEIIKRVIEDEFKESQATKNLESYAIWALSGVGLIQMD